MFTLRAPFQRKQTLFARLFFELQDTLWRLQPGPGLVDFDDAKGLMTFGSEDAVDFVLLLGDMCLADLQTCWACCQEVLGQLKELAGRTLTESCESLTRDFLEHRSHVEAVLAC